MKLKNILSLLLIGIQSLNPISAVAREISKWNYHQEIQRIKTCSKFKIQSEILVENSAKNLDRGIKDIPVYFRRIKW